MPDLYVSDFFSGNFQNFTPVEQFKSLSWTERWSQWGDFKLECRQSYQFRRIKDTPRFLHFSESRRVMQIETIDEGLDEDGDGIITVTGRDFVQFLENRNTESGAFRDGEPFTGKAADVVRFIVYKYAVDASSAGALNVIPELSSPSAPYGPDVTVWVERGPLYDIVKQVAESLNIGFWIRKGNVGETAFVFNVAEVNDRTDPSSAGTYREFSENAENLISASTLETVSSYHNHIRVFGAKTGVDVYGVGISPTVVGLGRRTTTADYPDIGSKVGETDPAKITTVAADQALLKTKGEQILASPEHRYNRLIDGSTNMPSNLWSLGDKVILKDADGQRAPMLITEKITSIDAGGYQVTPTFSAI